MMAKIKEMKFDDLETIFVYRESNQMLVLRRLINFKISLLSNEKLKGYTFAFLQNKVDINWFGPFVNKKHPPLHNANTMF